MTEPFRKSLKAALARVLELVAYAMWWIEMNVFCLNHQRLEYHAKVLRGEKPGFKP